MRTSTLRESLCEVRVSERKRERERESHESIVQPQQPSYPVLLHFASKLGSRVTDNKNIARGLLSPTDLMQPNTGSAKTSANGSTAPLTVTTANNSNVNISSGISSNVKLELNTGGNSIPVTTTTAQVITVVAPASNSSTGTPSNLLTARSSVADPQTSPSCLPSSNTGNPVLVQVSTGGQLIAVAVSPDSITQSNEPQAPGE